MKAILGKKLGMTQIIDEEQVIPVTVLKAGPCVVVRKKEKDKDGYNALQLGFEQIQEKELSKPVLGYFKKQAVKPTRFLREIRIEDDEVFASYKVGDEIKAGIFKKGDMVDVTGVSKGKGFAGVMKRYGFKGGPASHGSGQWHRRPGSIGASSDPSRVFKGKKMPGRMGGEKVTVRNLEVVDIDEKENLLLIKGCCPGKNGDLVIVRERKR